MNSFTYCVPTKVYFGKGQLEHLSEELAAYGRRILFVYGGGSIIKNGLYEKVTAAAEKAGCTLTELSGVKPNPRIDLVREGVRLCREEKIEAVLAVGGGSVIDTAKFVAAGACMDGDPWELTSPHTAVEKTLPLLTVPTMAATGSEMDASAVISNPETHDKIGRTVQAFYPKVSFLDPENTFTVSARQTACGSADILSHIMEEYFTMDEDLYMLDCVMEGLMKTVIRYAPIAMKEPDNYEARANLRWASEWAINGLIEGGKRQAWSCHPIEHELSAYYDITHGLGLAILTPRWMEYCLDEKNVSRYVQFGVNVFGLDAAQDPFETAREAIEKMKEFLYDTLGIESSLTEIGIDDARFPEMAKKAYRRGLVFAFKTLRPKDVENILRMCL